MLSFLNEYKKDITYSQNGEEGIILEVFKRIDAGQGHAVEIGGNDGRYCSNTALLAEAYGWSVKFVESDFNLWRLSVQNWANNPNVTSQCSHVDKYNIAAFVNSDCDLLSLDTDGSDYTLFKALEVSPKMVIAEIDSGIAPPSEEFNKDGGASYMSMLKLALEKGYFLLCHTGNMVFVENKYRKLFPEIIGDGLNNPEEYFNRAWVKE